MSLVERLEQCRLQLDWDIRAKVLNRDYDHAAANMRQVIEDAKKRIIELEGRAAVVEVHKKDEAPFAIMEGVYVRYPNTR